MAKHVISTLSADTDYADWITQPGVNTILKKVRVHGGAGISLQGAGQQRIITPDGIRTEVSDEDAKFLSEHGIFKQHAERGHVKIVDRPLDPDKVAQKMEPDTGSKPKTAADVAADAAKAAKTVGLKPEETLSVATNKGK